MDIRIAKANTALAVDVGQFAPGYDNFESYLEASPVALYIFRYGLTQILNDAHSAITEKSHPDAELRSAECMALAQKKLDAMIAGEVRSQSRGDSVTAEAMRLAIITVKTALKKHGIKLPDAKGLKARAEAYLAKHPELMDTARANIETAKALSGDVEL